MGDTDNKNGTLEQERTRELALDPITDSKMKMMIMDYFVAQGFKQSAERFRLEAGLDSMDMKSINIRKIIRQAIQSGMMQLAMHFVNKLHPELLQRDRELLFQLLNQQLIEIIRVGKVDQALTFSQTKLDEIGCTIPGAAQELERTMALLIFDNPEQSPLAHLLSQAHRNKVANVLNMALINCKYCANSMPNISSE